MTKPVIYRGQEIGRARSLKEAAAVAQRHGLPVDPERAEDIAQHIGEAPACFYAVREPGGRAW